MSRPRPAEPYQKAVVGVLASSLCCSPADERRAEDIEIAQGLGVSESERSAANRG